MAAVFALHPLHVESVAWVAERKDVLSTLFWLLTMWSYAGYAHRGGVKRYLITLLLFALGLMAKPMLVTLPFVMLLLDYWPLSRLQPKEFSIESLPQERNIENIKDKISIFFHLLLEKIPFFILAAVSSLITLIVQRKGRAVVALEMLSPVSRICNAVVSYVVYIVKTFVPTRLAVYYPYPDTVPIWQVAGAILLLVLISVAVLTVRRKYLVFGWLWYVVTLIPVIGLVQVGGQARADRYMYVPMTGLLIMVAWGLGNLAAKWQWRKFTLALAAGVCLSVLMVCTWLQVGYWHNSFTLFTRAIGVTTNNHIAHLNLGNFLIKQEKADEAIGHYKKAIEFHRDYVDAHFNLGIALSSEKRYDEAIKEYYTVLRLQKNYGGALLRLADALAQKGQLDKAISHYNRALQQNPSDVKVLNNFALALVKKGEIDGAIEYYRKSLEINPDSVEVLNNLGNALVKQKEFGWAVMHYEKALSLKPDFVETHYNLANALKQMGQFDEAVVYYQKALELKPDNVDAHYGLGLALAKLKKYDEAVICYKKAIQLKPDFAQAHYHLGIAFVNQKEIDKAIEQFREVLRIHPNDAEMHCNLGIVLAQKGRVDEAIKEFRIALHFNPEFSKAREQLKAALARKAVPNKKLD